MLLWGGESKGTAAGAIGVKGRVECPDEGWCQIKLITSCFYSEVCNHTARPVENTEINIQCIPKRNCLTKNLQNLSSLSMSVKLLAVSEVRKKS